MLLAEAESFIQADAFIVVRLPSYYFSTIQNSVGGEQRTTMAGFGSDL
jgi:hypothetical protein